MGISGCIFSIAKYEDHTSGLPIHSSAQPPLQFPADVQRKSPILQFVPCPLPLDLPLGTTEKESVLLAPSLQFYIDEICPESALLQAQQSQLSACPQKHGAQEELRGTEQESDDQCEQKLEWS